MEEVSVVGEINALWYCDADWLLETYASQELFQFHIKSFQTQTPQNNSLHDLEKNNFNSDNELFNKKIK